MKANLDPISIRPLTRGDEPILWIMCYLAIHVPPGEPPPPLNIVFRPEIAKYVRGWGQADDFGFAAFDEESLPVGAVWLRLLTGKNRGYGWVNDQTPELSIALLPEYRGRGIGTRLMQYALDEAQRRCAAVSLSVSRGNPAEKLYRRFGFRVVGQDDSSWIMLHTFKTDQ